MLVPIHRLSDESEARLPPEVPAYQLVTGVAEALNFEPSVWSMRPIFTPR